MNAFPFDSEIVGYDENNKPIYDRASNAEEFARLLASFLCNGVFGTSMCAVLADEGMTATVDVGHCLINGRYGYLDEPETVSFATAHATFTRIDTVVLRLDLSPSVNNLVIAVLSGTPASTPTAPTLTRDSTTWELGIANVIILPSSSAIVQSNITDTRLDSERCGIVAAIHSAIDTTALYLQIQSHLAQFQTNEQAHFHSWFATLQEVLDEDVAGNLFNLANSKATTLTQTATFSESGWSATAPYTQTVSALGILSTDNPIVDIVSLSNASASAQLEAFGCVGQILTATNEITATCFEDKPEADFTLQLKVIR